MKHQVLKAICEKDLPALQQCLTNGWKDNINDTVDHEGKFSALSLACYLDNLEAVHMLDLHGADLSKGVGKFGNTPLMQGVSKWNVRVIDYLLERGVDPLTADKFGFTAKRKAEIKQLRTIYSMLDSYENRFKI
jgi:ankyrin repeat protein